jgi:AhpD family alkylhydroperoxidase
MFDRSLQERLTSSSVRHITPVPSGAATGLVAEVYAQARNEFALVPPLTIHSVVPEILAGVWCLTREAFVVGRAGRGARETVAAAVSKSNECPYCLDVHSAMLHAVGTMGLQGNCSAIRKRPTAALSPGDWRPRHAAPTSSATRHSRPRTRRR